MAGDARPGPRVLASPALLEQDPPMGKPALDLSKLTADEKLDLIDDLWRSLSLDDLPLSSELCAELDRRLDRLELQGPVGVSWEDVRAEMSTGEP